MFIDVTNVQQMTGIACFALATVACMLAARYGSHAWRALAWTQAAFCLEIAFSFRHRLHDAIAAVLRDHGRYGERTSWQLGLLALVAVFLIVCVPTAWRIARRDRLATVAAAASLAVVAMLTVEAVSLHSIDAWMYFRVGPLLATVVGWAAASLVVTASATIATLVAARR